MARVQQPLQDVSATGPSGVYQSIPAATPEAFGGLIGQAEQKTGGQVQQAGTQLSDMALQFQQTKNATDALNATTAASADLGDAEMQLRNQKGNNAVAAYPAFKQQVADIEAKYSGQMTNPMAKMAFLRDFRSNAGRSLVNAGIHVAGQQDAAHLNALESSIKSEQSNLVRYTATGQEPDYTKLTDKTLMLAHEQGLDQESAHALLQKTTGQAMHDMVVARVASGDTKGAAQMLSKAMSANVPGTDLPLLDSSHQAALSQYILQKETLDANRALTDQMRSMAYQEKMERQNAEKAGNGYVSQILKDPTMVDPKAIADDPHLKFEQKWGINNMLQSTLAGKGAGHDVTTYGPGFYQLYQAVHAPVGDPNKITDPTQLYAQAGPNGALTVAGVDKLSAEIQGSRTPEGQAEGAMKKGALDYAKRHVSLEFEIGNTKFPDPEGEDRFDNGFLPAFYQAYDAGKAAGKSAYQLLSKDSPDYIVDKVMAPYKRTEQEEMKVRMEQDVAPGGADMSAATKAIAAAPEMELEHRLGRTLTQDDVVKAYQHGDLGYGPAAREAAARALTKMGVKFDQMPKAQ